MAYISHDETMSSINYISLVLILFGIVIFLYLISPEFELPDEIIFLPEIQNY